MSGTDELRMAEEDLCTVLSAWTGMPAARMRGRGPAATFFELVLGQARAGIFGQDAALEASVRAIARRCRLPRAASERRPLWTALFAGCSGVGKTASAREIGNSFFGEDATRVIDCSELAQEHYVARLTGAPPSYVGYGEPGQLVAALESRGSGLLLFDEVEKAHPVLWSSVLLPLLEEGVVHDMSSGRALYATEWIVILTANPGAGPLPGRPGFLGAGDGERGAHTRHAIEDRIPPELLGRLDDVIVFDGLDDAAARQIWDREEATLRRQLGSMEEPVGLEIAEEARAQLLAGLGTSAQRQGARAVMRLFRKTVVDHCLTLLDGAVGGTVRVEAGAGGLRYRVVERDGRSIESLLADPTNRL